MQSFGGALPVEHFARTIVEFIRDFFKLLLREPGEISALGEILSEESIRVLVASSLPRLTGQSSLATMRKNVLDGHYFFLTI